VSAGSRPRRAIGAETQALRAARLALRRSAALVLVAGLLLSCSGRERGNPFDPRNPETDGEPRALWAEARCGAVRLTWSDLGLKDVRGFRVYRTALAAQAPESLLTATPLSAATRRFEDETVCNGDAYRYALEFVFGAATARVQTVTARPGAALPWVADPCGTGLQLLAPDAGTVRLATSYGSLVYDLAVDAVHHRVYATDLASPGGVRIWSTDGEQEFDALPLAGATTVALSGAADRLAVGAFYEGRVVWMTTAGETILSLDLAAPSRLYPEALAFRDSTRTWIACTDSTGGAGRLLAVDLGRQLVDTLAAEVARPVDVADDVSGGGCWIADREAGEVLYVTDALSVRARAGRPFIAPRGLAADGQGRCWVTDPEAGLVALVDRDGVIVKSLSGLGPVRGIAYDPEARQLWITVPERGEVWLLATGQRAGESLGDTLGAAVLAGCPTQIAGDWSGGCAEAAR